ncbi:Response regulator receiver domain-containing protein [Desulfatibacillum alkenivorans DSM 16219]|jgi:DNA-binding NtrC family response regulator|uniref:Response regulator receiver domain-containing protein n=1 Tax=Desulfatibacillum alkenivorans DSM 16219 TaxID=1121393 RepID=A0A1M6XLD2_9BACT|nr:response regulator [Desulfatibacillum alkenivorans]SHL06718.1 Response regulator receiver domain-containing protein [Desulfatibacillum alkenivorans DSM 16219]
MEQKPLRILILDDEPIVCKRLQPALEKNGYEVEIFTSSMEAVQRFRKAQFDIVVTDLKMKELDGLQFLTEVKDSSPNTEVIVITGFATMETAKESFRKGGFDFLSKPFKIGEMLEVIKRAEAKVRQRQAESPSREG